MNADGSSMSEQHLLGAGIAQTDVIEWRCHTNVQKFSGLVLPSQVDEATPYEVRNIEGNILTFAGASTLWAFLIGTAGSLSLSNFGNANARLGVGDSVSATAASQTELQAGANKMRKAVDATYPQHADGTASQLNASVIFRSTFINADANWEWNEWGVFNAASGGRMLNRRVEPLGIKTSAATWTLTVTLSLA